MTVVLLVLYSVFCGSIGYIIGSFGRSKAEHDRYLVGKSWGVKLGRQNALEEMKKRADSKSEGAGAP